MSKQPVNNYYRILEGFPLIKPLEKLSEFNDFVDILREKGINVIVVKDTICPDTPGFYFPK